MGVSQSVTFLWHASLPCLKKVGSEVCWSFLILRKIGELAYRLDLPSELAGVHPVFHVSHLKKCLRVSEERVVRDALDIQNTLEYLEYPVKILDEVFKETRRSKIKFLKGQWSNHTE